MSKEIHLVKDAAQDIMNIILSKGTSQIKDVNLVTFTDDTYLDYYKRGQYVYGDPSTKLVLKENKDLTQIQMAFSNLTPMGGGSECEETSLSGIKLGLIESKKNSYMFVFTDAAPKDGHVQVEGVLKKWRLNYTLLAQKIEGVNKLAQSKGNPIFFFLTKHPRYECQQQDFSVYGNIAAATYGQVFTLHNKDDIKKALLFLEELISGSVDILERKVILAHQLGRVRFTVDDQIKCVFISATAPGFSRSYVDLDINLIYTHLTWTDNNKVLRIDKPAAGTYEAIVKGSKETTVMIFGRTDFEFQHGFSENVPATFRNDRRQPTEGVISFLLINITDPTRSVNIQTVQIVDTVSGKTWYNSTLKKKSKSYYYTEAFAPPPPKTIFIIEVIGKGKTSHKEIKRTSKLPIQSRPKDIDPEISIQGEGTYPYNSDVLLTCKVRAFPAPHIVWKDAEHKELNSSLTQNISEHNYISELHIKLTRSGVYYCQAKANLNNLNENSKSIDLHVMSPFEVHDDLPKESTRVKYGENLSISCGVTSKFPIKITWIKETEGLITESYKYSVISNGKVLLIKKATLESSGRYVCKVFIADDEQTQESRETSVQVIADPVVSIQGSGTYPYHSDVFLTCKVKASPEPRISWKDDNDKLLHSSLQQKIDTFNYVRKLQVKNLTRNSIYYCEAQTDLNGTSKRTLNASLHVMSPFEVQDNSSKEPTRVKYGQNQAISCGVTSKFPVKITWIKETEGLITDSDKYSVISNGKVLQIKKATLESSGRYICKVFIAGDEQTQESRETSVQVIADPVVSIQGSGTYPYNSDVLLTCKVKASPEPRITWKHDNHSVLYSSLQQKIDTFNYVRKLQVKNLTRNSIYYCEAQTDLNGTSKRTLNASLHVMSPFEVQDNSSKEPTRVKYGQNQAISCGVTSKFPVKITWIKETEGLITDSDKYSVISNGKVLQIKKATLESSGRYICKVFIAGDEQTQESRETSVQVIADPVVSIQGSGTYPYNSDVLLTCKVKASPEPRITWKHDNHSVLYSSLQQKIDTFNYVRKLQVKNLTRNSIYYCEAQTDLNGTSKRTLNASLHVMSPFEVQDNSSKEPTRVKYGQNQAISCGVTSKFPVKITWIKETEGLITDSDKYSVISNGKVLQIKKATLESSGRYICKVFIAGDEQTQESRETSVQVIADPVVSIQGSGTYPYNSDVLLTCKVKASPEPRITWKHDNHSVLYSSLQQKIDTFNYVRQLHIKNLTRNSTYYCEAQTDLNGTSKRTLNTSLHVMSPFEVQDDLSKVSVTAEFESSTVLTCNIKSNFSMKIQWYHVFRNTADILENSDLYMISSDGTEIKVNKVKQENEGRYFCVARLEDDKNTTHQLQRQIRIKHVAPVMGPSDKIYVYEGAPVNLNCNVVKAYPKPGVTWMFKSVESDVFRPMPEGDVLKINATSLSSAGVYKCTAANSEGYNTQETTITVLKKPLSRILVNNKEKEEVFVEYNSTVELACHVISHPPPKVVWNNAREEILHPVRVDPIHNGITSYLKVSPTRKSDVYSCNASNILDNNIKKVKLNVRSPFQVSSSAPAFTSVNYGDNLSINCGVTSKFPLKIIWMNETGALIAESENYSVKSNGEVLQIRKATLHSSGRYICKAFIADDEQTQESRETSVQVFADLPKVEIQPDIVTVFRNLNAVIKCHVTKGFPKPNITWMVMKEKMKNFTVLKEVGPELTVPSAQYHDAGSYKCIATNDIGNDEKTVQLVVKGPSKILSDANKLYMALVGDVSLRIPCATEGFPKPIITWTKGDKTLPADKFYVDIDNTLVIKNPQVEDSGGDYICKAVNSNGTDEKYFETKVLKYIDYDRDDDDIMGNTTYVDILEGTTKQLDCSSRSLKGRWYKSQAPKKGVETSTEAVTKSFIDRKFYSQYGYPLNLWGTLPIENAKSVQDGKYTCRLSDNTGSKSHTYIVNVGNPPVFHDPHDVDINDWQGRKEELSCAVADDMDPKTRTAKAEWTYNGNPSNLANAKITQSHHPIVSWGQYTCTISNIHGSIKKNFNVHSTGCLLPMNTTVNRSSLVLDTSGTWPKLTGDQHFRYIPHNQVVLLSCRSESNSNFFENIPRTSELKAKCNYEDNLLVNGKMYKPSDLQCSAEVAPTIQATGQKCFYENSEIFNLGFDVVQPEPHFLNVFTVCFDKSKNVPIYTKVNVSQTNNIGLDVQKTLWKKFGIYDEKNEEFCEEGSKCCVKPRQLVGQLEVANGPAQLATFIKGLNTVPYWDGCQNIINDNLDEFDRWISLTRHRLSDPYELNSGAFKYVETNGIMVPRYLWKAVWKVVRRVQIPLIYVRVNDPHPKHEDIHCESHCPSILEKHKGPYSYCCTPAEFHKAFDLDVMNI
ncbi:hypothetical protein O0L34_g9432 [Tuta absoluta]|nr:hypothetical protein O0L34_g9432 [Tuta absoluta]